MFSSAFERGGVSLKMSKKMKSWRKLKRLLISTQRRKVAQSGRGENLNVTSGVVLPVSMLSFSNWELVLIIGNIQQMFWLHEDGCGRNCCDKGAGIVELEVKSLCEMS